VEEAEERRRMFFYSPCASGKRGIYYRTRAHERDRKTSEIIINLVDDDKNRAERQIIVASAMHFPLGRIGPDNPI